MGVTDIKGNTINEGDTIVVARLIYRRAALKIGKVTEITPGGNVKYQPEGYNYDIICKTGQILKLL